MRRGHRRADPAKVAPIKQVCVAIFAQRDDETGRCRTRHVHQQWTRASDLLVCLIELEPIGGRPVIAGIAAKNRARLKTNHCFAAAPVASRSGSVTGGNKRIGAVTGDAPDSPYTAAVKWSGSPCCYAGRIIYRHSHQPAMKVVAILHTPIPHIENVAHDGERRSLLLDRWNKVDPVV